MAHKVLIALDSSPGAWGAVEYVAEAFGKTPGCRSRCCRCCRVCRRLSGMTATSWKKRKKNRGSGLVGGWQTEQEKKWQGLVKKAHERLTKAGVAKDAVVNQFKPKYYDVAEDILSEAAAGKLATPSSWAAAAWAWPRPCLGKRDQQGGAER